MTEEPYVHGYGEREAQRLLDQADSVRDLIHHDTEFQPDSRVLEVACGVGAQTVAIASQNPSARITSFDKAPDSVAHGSCYFHPSTPEAVQAWNCLIEVQAALGGDSQVGRRLYPLLNAAGFEDVRVSPRMVYADSNRPRVQHQFVMRTIVPMVEGVRDQALADGLMSRTGWDKGINDLKATGSGDGTFCYTFFKARARARTDGVPGVR